MPGDDLVPGRTDRQVGDELSGGRIVNGSNTRVGVADGQLAVVWVKSQSIRTRLLGQLPSVEFPAGRQVEAEDPTLLTDRQLPAVRAESPPKDLPRFLAQHRFPIGQTPHPQLVPIFEPGQVPAVGDRKSTRLNSSHLGIS